MFKKITFVAISVLFCYHGFSQTVNNETELNSAISNATAGTTITLANGTWENIFINISDKNGTSSAPITITAETPNLVLMTGNSRVYMEGAYITVSGLVFQDADTLTLNDDEDEIEPVFELKECDNCRVINNKIDTYNGTEEQKELKFKWILTDGQYNEIAYNSFIGKYGIGSIINDNRNSNEEDFLKIHHNYFANRTPINQVNDDNDQDAIRIGNSSTSLNDSSSEVYNNYFYNFFGEVEMISNKSGNNKYYNNTFRDYAGSLTLRHGNNCEVYGNYFFAENNIFSAGVRVIGENHKIYNNYIENVNSTKIDGSTSNATGGINVSNGRIDTELNGYYQVLNTTITNNTFVDCDYALRIGTLVQDDLSLEPENLIVANNIMLNSSESALQEVTAPSGGTSIYEGNITQNGSWDLTNGTNNNSTVTENLLIAGTDFYELTSISDAISAGIGSYDFLTDDILGGNRDTNFDAGAEEFGSNGTNLPYTNADVGVNIGFGVGFDIIDQPSLTVSENELNLSVNNSDTNISIISNVDWTITENITWLTIDTASGAGNIAITISATTNTTGVQRSGTITINEVSGGNDLSTTITVTQSDGIFSPDNADEIPVDTVTAVGTQTDDGGNLVNGPENTIDNNTSTRWSAESTDGSAFLTFDLGCVHTLTDVSIFFHKSSIRTTKISIATSTNGIDYTNVYTEVSSSLLDPEDYEDFEMNLTNAQYIRIFGFGNSEGSPWNSIEEVQFFGDANCTDNSLSTNNAVLEDLGVTIYPIPVSNGEMTIASKNLELNKINIFNVTGKKVLTTNAKSSYTTKINTTNLTSGIYYIVIEGIGASKFIKK